MKSRLLPSPLTDALAEPSSADSWSPSDALAAPMQRRTTDLPEDRLYVDDLLETVASPRESERHNVDTAPGSADSPNEPRTGPPTSRRPQGRLWIAALLFAALVGTGAALFQTLSGPLARGVVSGRLLRVAASRDGTIASIAVQLGEHVRAGDLLARVEDPELTDQLARLADQLHTARAALQAEQSILQDAQQRQQENRQAAEASYHDLRGELAVEQARLADLNGKLARRRVLAERQMVAQEELESIRFAQQGLEQKIAHLRLAIAATSARRESAKQPNREQTRLEPHHAEIARLQAEIKRLRVRQEQGTLRSPVAGTVVSVPLHEGERLRPGDHVVELLERGSLELAVYVEPRNQTRFVTGRRAEAVIARTNDRIVCQVDRIGARLERPPLELQRADRPGETLLPIYLKPSDETRFHTSLPLGSLVMVESIEAGIGR